MKHGVLATTLSALAFALTAHAITVDGHVFLSGQTDHTGTLIRFRAVSPSARTDSTHSYNTGYFTVALQPGVYDVEFSNNGYAAFTLEDQALLFDTTLETQRLLLPLSGYVSGTLGPGEFDVVDTIRVDEGDSLTIAAGTRLYFRCGIPFEVYGVLEALGTESDSIWFTQRVPGCRWTGVRFRQSSSVANRVEYAVIERADYAAGGDFDMGHPQFTFDHCAIRNNGRGLFFYGGTISVAHSQFTSNESYALYAYESAHAITDCEFNNNSSAVWTADDPNCLIARCVFSQNGQSVGLYAGTMEDCVIDQRGGLDYAVYCGLSTTVRRCTIRGAILCEGDEATLSSCVIAFSQSYFLPAIVFGDAAGMRVLYTCFYGNSRGDFSGETPPALGIVAFTNANGDSCDTYYNIFLDPQFTDTGAGDYHLTGGSPCIDAGDPSLAHDPDGTVADMGAFYFNQLASPEPDRTAVRGYELGQNYPNPFNAQTRISFELARAGEVTLEVFDITGRLVRRLVDGMMSEGRHEIKLDARDLPSGVYVYGLAAGDVIEARKMILIR